MNQASEYRKFAEVYDNVIDQSKNFLLFLKNLIDKSSNVKIADLGCGTGKFTIPLALQGFEVTGFDSSQEMLAVAKRKAEQAGAKICFQESLIEEINQAKEFDYVVSCDCLNHFLGESSLLNAISSAKSLLKDNGKFVFHLCSKKYFQANDREENYGGRIGQDYFLWEDKLNKDVLEITLSIFEKQKDNSFVKREAVVRQKAYPLKTVFSLLKKAGFEKIQVFNEFGEPGLEEDEQHYFVAKA